MYNNIRTVNSRFDLFENFKNYHFLSIHYSLPLWFSNYPLYRTYNITRDGKKFEIQKYQNLFSAYFYLSNVQTMHRSNLYTIFNFMSNIGGLFTILFTSFYIIGAKLNRELLLSKITRAMFFVSTSNKTLNRNTTIATHLPDNNTTDVIKRFNYKDTLTNLRYKCCSIFFVCCMKK